MKSWPIGSVPPSPGSIIVPACGANGDWLARVLCPWLFEPEIQWASLWDPKSRESTPVLLRGEDIERWTA